MDEVYFVFDGNHRISIARQLGAPTIEAYVTKLDTPIVFTPDTDLPTLILQTEKLQFLQHTRLAQLRPEAKIEATSPGAYKQLEDIIIASGCYYWMKQDCLIDWEEYVAHDWFSHLFRESSQGLSPSASRR